MTATAAAASLLVAGGGLGLWWGSGAPRRKDQYDYGGITCAEVLRRAEAYRAGTLAEADRERVRRHLARCPNCQFAFPSADAPGSV